ncbi:PREDICTED: protein NDRG3 [Atta cephalotes]|uniref:Protein NDRG3 n=1 Tax=Atta cephalotes TaxID=12957 RepID=A0A158P2P3_ATTCE|nr:PREDICTED: protein NDRG3 [Atta cephalotes]
MIKKISEYAKPKIWCPQEDYHLPGDGISISTTSAFPSSINEESKIAIYYKTGMKCEDGRIFVLQPSIVITTDTTCHSFTYPSMEELAEQLLFVLGHFGIKSVIGFGVGAGGNILARFALAHPEKVNALCLINCVSTQAGWIEWGYQKLNVRHLRSQGMTQGVLDYLMWHHFGRGTEERNHDLVQVYKNYFERRVNPTNLALFIDSYVRRTDLNITRELDPTRKKEGLTLSVPVMNITGALSPHVDDTVTLNGRLDPTNSSWMKISDCGMVLEEQPGKVSEAFRLFLQGEGYVMRSPRKPVKPTTPEVAPLSPLKMADYRLASLEGLNHVCSKKIDWPTATIHITENPISEAVVC